MSDNRIYDSPDCIETLIKKKENYPYYYWFIWVFSLIIFAGVLSVRACQELTLEKGYVNSKTNIINTGTNIHKNAYNNLIHKAKSEQHFLLKIQKNI